MDWTNVIGLLIGTLGLIFSVYFYKKSRIERHPVFALDPARTEILSSKRVAGVPIRVLKRKDNCEVQSDLTAVRFYFWNEGSTSIRADTVLEPIKIELADPDAEIIDTKLLKISREITKLELSPDPKSPDKSLILSFLILEHHDGTTGQIIFEGNPKANFTISGTIEGVEYIRNETNLNLFSRVLKTRVSIILLTEMLIAIVMGIYFQVRFTAFKRELGGLPKEIELMRYIMYLAIPAVLIFCSWSIFNAARRARRVITQLVPTRILPPDD